MQCKTAAVGCIAPYENHPHPKLQHSDEWVRLQKFSYTKLGFSYSLTIFCLFYDINIEGRGNKNVFSQFFLLGQAKLAIFSHCKNAGKDVDMVANSNV